MPSTAATKANAHLIARAHEIIATWEKAEHEDAERRVAHAEWVTYMVEVERIRPETLPCVHGTAMWPDRGQVCGACEAEAEDYAFEDRTPEEIEADRLKVALDQATREAESAAVGVGAWMAPF